MNELEKQLAEVVKKSLEAAETTGQFVLDQAPDLINQFIMWRTAAHSFVIFVLLSVVVLLVFAFQKIGKSTDDGWSTKILGKYHDNDLVGIYGTLILFSSIICFTISMTELFQLLKIIVAPKIYIIEYFIDKL